MIKIVREVDNMCKKKSSIIRVGSGVMIDPNIQHGMLKCCKFCGLENRFFYYTKILGRCYVMCNVCGYKTRKHSTEYQAMVEWNKENI